MCTYIATYVNLSNGESVILLKSYTVQLPKCISLPDYSLYKKTLLKDGDTQ